MVNVCFGLWHYQQQSAGLTRPTVCHVYFQLIHVYLYVCVIKLPPRIEVDHQLWCIRVQLLSSKWNFTIEIFFKYLLLCCECILNYFVFKEQMVQALSSTMLATSWKKQFLPGWFSLYGTWGCICSRTLCYYSTNFNLLRSVRVSSVLSLISLNKAVILRLHSSCTDGLRVYKHTMWWF